MGEDYKEKTPKEGYTEGFALEKRARALKASDNERGQLLIQASAMYQGAAEGLERQGKYGSSEKFWKKSKALYEEVMGNKDYFSQKQIDKVYRKRLVHIGKYLQRREDRTKGLEAKTTATVAIIGLVASIFFLSADLTGNAIGSSSISTTNIIGALFLVVGLVFAFIYFKRR